MTNPLPHILIVDDNPENIRVLGSALGNNSYKISIASDGDIALKLIEKHLPDLILLDVMMPNMDGFEVCEVLKANPRTSSVEIIFITAAIDPNDELKGLALGAVDYIHKPFSIPIVQAKVELHLERVTHRKLRDDVECMARHDLKNPLNAIMGFPQLMMLDDNLTDEQRGYLEAMQTAGNEMLNMINNSLNLFKIETGCYQYNPQPLDMCVLIKTILKDLMMFAECYRVSINTQAATEFFMILAEKDLSYTLFANLIRNAIEACSAGDTITIDMRYEQDQGVISITNPGSVPEKIRASFFDKYVTAGKTQGTGLGTYSARLMTITQNGTIAMTTNSKETCITVRLPIA